MEKINFSTNTEGTLRESRPLPSIKIRRIQSTEEREGEREDRRVRGVFR